MTAKDAVTKVEAVFSGAERRPVALVGRSSSGKTTLLRRVAGAREVVWHTARDLAQELLDAAREDRVAAFGAAIAADPRPLCVEHVEDLRGKQVTQRELERVLQAAARRRGVVLSLTLQADAAQVQGWLSSWAEVVEP